MHGRVRRGVGVVAVAMGLALAGCGDDDDGSPAPAPSDPLAPFQGTWVNCFDNGDGTSARSSLALSGGTYVATATSHPTANCTGTADPLFADSGTVAARAPVDATYAGTTVKAVPLDVVSRTSGPFYDLGHVDTALDPDVLFLGDTSGANDGTTAAQRPTTLDTSTPFVKQ